MTFAEALREQIALQGVSYVALGERTGLGQSRISQIVKQDNLTEETVNKVAAGLGLVVSLLFTRKTHFPPLQNKRIVYAPNSKTGNSTTG